MITTAAMANFARVLILVFADAGGTAAGPRFTGCGPVCAGETAGAGCAGIEPCCAGPDCSWPRVPHFVQNGPPVKGEPHFTQKLAILNSPLLPLLNFVS